MALSYIEVFREILRMDEQSRFPMDNLFMESSDDEMGRRPTYINGRMIQHMGMDREEEEYWDGPDSEGDAQELAANNPLVNGSGPLSALVDYHSDEESDETGDVVMKTANAEEAKGEKKTTEETKAEDEAGSESKQENTPESTPSLPALTPPSRLSEKRRREEEDDDEMGKMMQHKRRNSQSTIANSAAAAALLKKKQQPFGLTSKAGGAGTKKIDIRLNTTPQPSPVANGDTAKETD